MLTLRTREDLQRLVDERLPESLTLEYKGSPALNRTNDGRSELVKDVTALANSAGGQIVYGIRERMGFPTEIDEGVDRGQFTPEWIEQVLATNSSPRLQSLSINEIPLGIDANRVAYVVSVPQSETFAPHQNTTDHKYYRRFERRSVPMADYEIRDAMLRNQKPYLEVSFEFPDGTQSFEMRYNRNVFRIRPRLMNHSSEPALYSLFKVLIDSRLEIMESPGGLESIPAGIILWETTYQAYEKRYAVPADFPLIRGVSQTFLPADFVFYIPEEHLNTDCSFILAYQCVAAPGTITEGIQCVSLNGTLLVITDPILVTKDGINMLQKRESELSVDIENGTITTS